MWGDVSWALTPEKTPILVIAFFVMLVVGAYANAVLAGAQASLLRLLCAPRDAELQARVEQLTAARATLVRALGGRGVMLVRSITTCSFADSRNRWQTSPMHQRESRPKTVPDPAGRILRATSQASAGSRAEALPSLEPAEIRGESGDT